MAHRDWTDGAPLSVVKQSVGASFRGGTHWSHFPWSDENVYIRPGVDGAHIKIGDAGNPTSVQIKDSWFPYVDGNTYIRARSTNNAIKIGDALAGRIELGAPVDAGKASVKQLCVGSFKAPARDPGEHPASQHVTQQLQQFPLG